MGCVDIWNLFVVISQPMSRTTLLKAKGFIFGILIIESLVIFGSNTQGDDLYITTADLNLRSGPGTSYKSVTILSKGDTVELLSNPAQYWVKLKFKSYAGYSASKYLQRIPAVEVKEPVKREESKNNILLYICLIAAALIIIIPRRSGKSKQVSTTQSSGSRKYNRDVKSMDIPKIKITVGAETSIIDVNQEHYDLGIEHHKDSKVPYWSHSYVYSVDDIRHATKAQKEFYQYLKGEVLKGEFVDIEGNTNYAFILYYDLLNEYYSHRDIELLESQFKLIGDICPRTRSYSLDTLRKELTNLETEWARNKLEQYSDPTYVYENRFSDYNPDMYKLGNQYREQLDLSKREIYWLNRFYKPSNSFIAIEGCCVAVIRAFLYSLKALDTSLKQSGSSLKKVIENFQKKIGKVYVKKHDYFQYYSNSQLLSHIESQIFELIFKITENEVRAVYQHKRKLAVELNSGDSNLDSEFDQGITTPIIDIINTFNKDHIKPDLDTQRKLNAINVNRWTVEFELSKSTYSQKDSSVFLDNLSHLEMSNADNPKIEALFFEAAKFLSKHDRVEALRSYTKYVYYNTISSYKKKDIPHQLKKAISDSDKLTNYESILRELVKSKLLDESLKAVNDLFIPKRKKISLDKSEIDIVRRKHEGTVGLLNKYLETEEEPSQEIKLIETPDKSNISESTSNSLFKKKIGLSSIQEELIKKIVENDFIIQQSEVDVYASQNALFKNQLIDAINQACEGLLEGEPLIEEDDDSYIIEQSYYQEILE